MYPTCNLENISSGPQNIRFHHSKQSMIINGVRDANFRQYIHVCNMLSLLETQIHGNSKYLKRHEFRALTHFLGMGPGPMELGKLAAF